MVEINACIESFKERGFPFACLAVDGCERDLGVDISTSFEFLLCVLCTGCDVVMNRCAVCLLLLRGKDDSLSFFLNAFSFLRQRVSMCLLDGRRIPVWKG